MISLHISVCVHVLLVFAVPCEEFTYTNGGNCPEVSGLDDKEEFRAMQNAFTVVGVKPDVQRVIFRILAAVLHMGNIQYKTKSRSSDDANIPVSFFNLCCHLTDCLKQSMSIC